MKSSEMKLDEDLRPDREDEFQTDDEENQAERVFNHMDDDTDSDATFPSQNLSNDNIDISSNPSWPRSYRQSMDMLTSVTPPPVSFLRRDGLPSPASKRYVGGQDDSSLSEPFISETSSINNEEPIPKNFTSQSREPISSIYSDGELPPPQQQCSFAQAVVNGANLLCGIGLLTIPYAVKEGGWLSLTILMMFGIICCYTGILLKRCLESSPELTTYPDIGQAAFGVAGRLGISIFLYMELYASCVEFLTLMADNLSSVFPNTHVRFAGLSLDTHQTFAITAALFVLPTVLLRNLSLLSYLSAGGLLSSIIVTLCLLWVGVVDQVEFQPGGKVLDFANLSVTIGLYGFGFSGHSVFPNIYSSMQDRSKFSLVLACSFMFCFVLYIGVGTAGYLLFGDSAASQFTLNMPGELYASKIAKWTTVATPLAKFALTLLPIALSIEELLPSSKPRRYSTSALIRTTLLISCLVVALTIPYFGSVMALIGSFLAMLVALIYPCACYLKIHGGRLSKMQVTSCVLIIITGAVCSIIGTYSAFMRLIAEGD